MTSRPFHSDFGWGHWPQPIPAGGPGRGLGLSGVCDVDAVSFGNDLWWPSWPVGGGGGIVIESRDALAPAGPWKSVEVVPASEYGVRDWSGLVDAPAGMLILRVGAVPAP